ncbi:unnamed protein product [Psylliodes chrysocephalus]|uniref:Uncharacterized protein n=1 Tax=Psylliodes chrysocephalus TaxID=3402493 RepID=A0A9P0CR44_9CUCU|nr:unnamed protein product [Psylliodes chrysocephala]
MECDESLKEEYDNIKSQIAALRSTTIVLSNQREINFYHKLFCTMLDGKTCNVLTNTTYTQACNVCRVTPKDINDLDNVIYRECDESTYQIRVSILHDFLRCYEYLLHIYYKLELQKGQAQGPEENRK